MTSLMSHAWGCYPGGVVRELRCGADPNAQDASGYTALMWLCRMYDHRFRERKRMFRALLRYGASLSVCDTAGQDVLAHACDGPERRFKLFIVSEVKRIRRARGEE